MLHSKLKNKMGNSISPGETSCYEPSHLDLYCLHRHLRWSTKLKRLTTCVFNCVTSKYNLLNALFRMQTYFCAWLFSAALSHKMLKERLGTGIDK